MTQADAKAKLFESAKKIQKLLIVLESLEAKNKERVWLKNQISDKVGSFLFSLL